ncbi:MAG: endonuclease III domain-containing protein [Planctomycetota bacterium]
MPGTKLKLDVPRGFSLKHAVASYGYFLLAPNYWDIHRQALGRPLHTGDGRVVRCVIRQVGNASGKPLEIVADRVVARAQHADLKQQVARMLRLDEDQRDWFRVCPEAKTSRFERMFRSPNLFEDMIKTITSCNVSWRNTITMNRRMCELVGDGGFPTPAQLADFGETRLKEQCRVGYRAERIVRLAKNVDTGELDLAWFEDPQRTSDELFDALKAIHGIGPYAAGNIIHLIGKYDYLAIDTETYRHFCLHYDVKRPKTAAGIRKLEKRIEKHYAAYAPFQFKAYWFELWRDYESRYGRAWTWDRDTTGQNFTAAVLES